MQQSLSVTMLLRKERLVFSGHPGGMSNKLSFEVRFDRGKGAFEPTLMDMRTGRKWGMLVALVSWTSFLNKKTRVADTLLA